MSNDLEATNYNSLTWWTEYAQLEAKASQINDTLAEDAFATDQVRQLFEVAQAKATERLAMVGRDETHRQDVLGVVDKALGGLSQLGLLEGLVADDELEAVRMPLIRSLGVGTKFLTAMSREGDIDRESVLERLNAASQWGGEIIVAQQVEVVEIAEVDEPAQPTQVETPVAPATEVGDSSAAADDAVNESAGGGSGVSSSSESASEPIEVTTEVVEAGVHDMAEEETADEVLLITVKGHHLEIGEDGKLVSLTDREGVLDNAVLSALEYLAVRPGEGIALGEIRKHLVEQGVLDSGATRDVMRNLMIKLMSLNHNSLPLVINNGLHARASKYYITGNVLVVREEQYAEGATSPESVEDETLCATLGDLYVTALHLSRFKDWFTASGLEPISEQLVEDLEEQYAPKNTEQKSAEEIKEQRQAALERITAVLNDNDKLADLANRLDQDSAAYRLVEAFLALQGEEERTIVTLLFDSTIEQVAQHRTGRRVGEGLSIVGTRVIGPDGVEVIPLNTPMPDQPRYVSFKEDGTLAPTVPEDEKIDTPQMDEVSSDAPVAAKQVESGTQKVTPATLARQSVRKRRPASPDEVTESIKEARLDAFEESAAEIAASLYAKGIRPGRSYRSKSILGAHHAFTRRAVASARGNGVGPKRRHPDFSLEEMVEILLWNSDSNLYAVHKKQSGRNIKTAIAEAIVALESEE